MLTEKFEYTGIYCLYTVEIIALNAQEQPRYSLVRTTMINNKLRFILVNKLLSMKHMIKAKQHLKAYSTVHRNSNMYFLQLET